MVSFSVFSSPAPRPKPWRAAFTLVELLVVMAIIIVMTALVVPAFTSISGGGNFSSAASDIGSTLEQARAYAMANNTYVYVGIGEYDVTEASSVSRRTSGAGKYGQIVLAVVASRDGSRGYDINNTGTWSTNYQNAQNGSSLLTAIDKLHFYNNVHLADFGNTPPTIGRMARVYFGADATQNAQYTQYCLGNPSSTSVIHFSWPLGSVLDSGQYDFTKVIQIDPQGVARMQTDSNVDGITSFMEIDLQPTRGNVVPPLPDDQNVGNRAALRLDCMTGSTRVYQP